MISPTSSINKLRNSLTTFYVKSGCSHRASPIKEDSSMMQGLLRMQQKEIDRLEHQNKNLQMLTKHQCSLIYQERTIRTQSTRLLPPELPQQPQKQQHNRRSTIKHVLTAMKPPPRKITVNSKLNMQNNECFKLSTVLDVNDQEAKQLYNEDSSIQLIKEILKDEDSFIDIITTYPPQQVSIIYDKLKKMFNEHEQMFEIVLKFKQILQNQFNLQNIGLMQEALNQLQQQTKEILNCKNVQIITNQECEKSYIQHIFKSKQMINLKNAKYDDRFKQEDFNQLLASPILDNNQCLGVLVCEDKSLNFTDEDQILIKYLCKQANFILNSRPSVTKIENQFQKFRHALKSLLLLQQAESVEQLIQLAQIRLCELTNSPESKILLGTLENSIVGQAIKENRTLYVKNCYNHENYQPSIDINTQLSIVAMPLKYKQIVGGVEFIQQNYLNTDQEVIDLFIQIIAITLHHFN